MLIAAETLLDIFLVGYDCVCYLLSGTNAKEAARWIGDCMQVGVSTQRELLRHKTHAMRRHSLSC